MTKGPEVYLSAECTSLHGFGFKGSILRKEGLRPAEGRLARPAEMAISAYWMPEQTAEWRVRLAALAVYRVAMPMACPSPYEGRNLFWRAPGKSVAASFPPQEANCHLRL